MILGAVLAIATSLFVKLWEFWITDRRTKERLKLLLKGEIRSICETIDRLRSDSAAYIALIRVIEINALRQGFDRNSDWVVIMKEHEFKKDLMEWYKDLGVACLQSNVVETAPIGDVPTEATRGNERQRLLQKFADLATNGRHLLERIERQ